MAANLNKIIIPTLQDATFGDSVGAMFDNVNRNFQKLGNLNLTKGEKGDGVIYVVFDTNCIFKEDWTDTSGHAAYYQEMMGKNAETDNGGASKDEANDYAKVCRWILQHISDAIDEKIGEDWNWTFVVEGQRGNSETITYYSNWISKYLSEETSAEDKERILKQYGDYIPGEILLGFVKGEENEGELFDMFGDWNLIGSNAIIYLDPRYRNNTISHTVEYSKNNDGEDNGNDDQTCIMYLEPFDNNGKHDYKCKIVNTLPCLWRDPESGKYYFKLNGIQTNIPASGDDGLPGKAAEFKIVVKSKYPATVNGKVSDEHIYDVVKFVGFDDDYTYRRLDNVPCVVLEELGENNDTSKPYAIWFSTIKTVENGVDETLGQKYKHQVICADENKFNPQQIDRYTLFDVLRYMDVYANDSGQVGKPWAHGLLIPIGTGTVNRLEAEEVGELNPGVVQGRANAIGGITGSLAQSKDETLPYASHYIYADVSGYKSGTEQADPADPDGYDYWLPGMGDRKSIKYKTSVRTDVKNPFLSNVFNKRVLHIGSLDTYWLGNKNGSTGMNNPATPGDNVFEESLLHIDEPTTITRYRDRKKYDGKMNEKWLPLLNVEGDVIVGSKWHVNGGSGSGGLMIFGEVENGESFGVPKLDDGKNFSLWTKGNVCIPGIFGQGGNLNIDSDLTVNGDLTVKRNTSLTGYLKVDGTTGRTFMWQNGTYKYPEGMRVKNAIGTNFVLSDKGFAIPIPKTEQPDNENIIYYADPAGDALFYVDENGYLRTEQLKVNDSGEVLGGLTVKKGLQVKSGDVDVTEDVNVEGNVNVTNNVDVTEDVIAKNLKRKTGKTEILLADGTSLKEVKKSDVEVKSGYDNSPIILDMGDAYAESLRYIQFNLVQKGDHEQYLLGVNKILPAGYYASNENVHYAYENGDMIKDADGNYKKFNNDSPEPLDGYKEKLISTGSEPRKINDLKYLGISYEIGSFNWFNGNGGGTIWKDYNVIWKTNGNGGWEVCEKYQIQNTDYYYIASTNIGYWDKPNMKFNDTAGKWEFAGSYTTRAYPAGFIVLFGDDDGKIKPLYPNEEGETRGYLNSVLYAPRYKQKSVKSGGDSNSKAIYSDYSNYSIPTDIPKNASTEEANSHELNKYTMQKVGLCGPEKPKNSNYLSWEGWFDKTRGLSLGEIITKAISDSEPPVQGKKEKIPGYGYMFRIPVSKIKGMEFSEVDTWNKLCLYEQDGDFYSEDVPTITKISRNSKKEEQSIGGGNIVFWWAKKERTLDSNDKELLNEVISVKALTSNGKSDDDWILGLNQFRMFAGVGLRAKTDAEGKLTGIESYIKPALDVGKFSLWLGYAINMMLINGTNNLKIGLKNKRAIYDDNVGFSSNWDQFTIKEDELCLINISGAATGAFPLKQYDDNIGIGDRLTLDIVSGSFSIRGNVSYRSSKLIDNTSINNDELNNHVYPIEITDYAPNEGEYYLCAGYAGSFKTELQGTNQGGTNSDFAFLAAIPMIDITGYELTVSYPSMDDQVINGATGTLDKTIYLKSNNTTYDSSMFRNPETPKYGTKQISDNKYEFDTKEILEWDKTTDPNVKRYINGSWPAGKITTPNSKTIEVKLRTYDSFCASFVRERAKLYKKIDGKYEEISGTNTSTFGDMTEHTWEFEYTRNKESIKISSTDSGIKGYNIYYQSGGDPLTDVETGPDGTKYLSVTIPDKGDTVWLVVKKP